MARYGIPRTLNLDNHTGDAFGRLRVSEPHTLFDSKLLGLDDQPLFWDEQLESGAGITASTPTAAQPYIDYTSTDSTAGVFTRQTFRRFNYQPGKSHLILMTGVLDLSGGGTGVERRIGYFDDNNGLFFEDDAGTVGVTVRTNDSGSPVDTTVTQANWDDPMDGTGMSGLTIDWTASHIFVIDFQWLGVGRIRFGLEIDGVLYVVHAVSQSNSAAIPWASTPCLPLRYQMVTTGSSPVSTMRCICSAVISEGGQDELGVLHHKGTRGAHVVMNTENTLYALQGIRLKSTHLGTTVKIIKTAIALFSASDDIEWILIFDPTIAGSPSWTGLTNSSVEYFNGAVANTVTGGTHIDGGWVSTGAGASAAGGDSQAIANALLLGSAIDGTPQTIVLCASPVNGSETNVFAEGAIIFREII